MIVDAVRKGAPFGVGCDHTRLVFNLVPHGRSFSGSLFLLYVFRTNRRLSLAANEGETAFQFCGEVGAFRGDSDLRQGRFSSLRLPCCPAFSVRYRTEQCSTIAYRLLPPTKLFCRGYGRQRRAQKHLRGNRPCGAASGRTAHRSKGVRENGTHKDCLAEEALSKNLIHLLTHLLTPRRLQVAHRALHVRVTQPLLHRAQINASPQAPRGECRTELVQPEVLIVEVCTLCNRFQAIEKIELRIASRSGEHKAASLVRLSLPRLETLDQLRRNRNLAFFVRLRRPSSVRFVADTNGRMGEVDVRPVRVHDFLLSHSRHQEELVPEPLFLIASRKQLVEFFLLVNLRFLFGVARPVVLLHQPANAVRLQERHDVCKLVPAGTWSLIFVIPQEGAKFQQAFALDVF